ncbi:hypothetical protein D3C78_1291960 [compost metagenome]
MQAAQIRQQGATLIEVRGELVTDALAGDHVELEAQMFPLNFEVFCQGFISCSSGSRHEAPDHLQVAVDRLAFHHLANGVDGLLQFPIQLDGVLKAVLAFKITEAVLERTRDVACVSSTGAAADLVRIDDGDGAPSSQERDGRAHGGNARANDHHIAAAG